MPASNEQGGVAHRHVAGCLSAHLGGLPGPFESYHLPDDFLAPLAVSSRRLFFSSEVATASNQSDFFLNISQSLRLEAPTHRM